MELNYLFLLPVTILLTWIVTFTVTERYHQLHDKILLALLGCCAVTCYIELRAVVDGTNDHMFIVLDNVETISALSICPLFFMYMRTVAHDVRWHDWYWWLFAPSVILAVAVILMSFMLGWDGINEVRKVAHLSGGLSPENTLGQIYRIINYSVFNITLEVMAVVLVGFSIFYLAQYYRQVEDYYANLEESSALRMNYFLFSTLVLLILMFLITFYIDDIVQCGHALILVISLCLSVFVWSLCYNAHKIVLTDQLLDIITLEQSNEQDAQQKNPTEDVRVPGIWEETISQKVSEWQNQADKPYCKEGLTLAEVARDVQVNQRMLSMYINKCKGMNFNRWINTLRIEESKRLFLSSQDVKIGYVSAICGYADQAAFSKAFRLIEGCSPGEYISKSRK